MPRRSRVNIQQKKRTAKRPLNQFFKQMLSAKKQGLMSFKYKNKTYKARRHEKLGLIYKKV